jgi:hypothetical protein
MLLLPPAAGCRAAVRTRLRASIIRVSQPAKYRTRQENRWSGRERIGERERVAAKLFARLKRPTPPVPSRLRAFSSTLRSPPPSLLDLVRHLALPARPRPPQLSCAPNPAATSPDSRQNRFLTCTFVIFFLPSRLHAWTDAPSPAGCGCFCYFFPSVRTEN